MAADGDVAIGSLTGPDAHTGAIYNAAFSVAGDRFVTAGADGEARVWRATDGAAVVGLIGHANLVLDAQFSPDGSRVATASADGTARIWDVGSGLELARLVLNEGLAGDAVSAVEAVQFSEDGAQVAVLGGDGPGPTGWDVSWFMGPADRARGGLSSALAVVCDPASGHLRGTLRLLAAQGIAAVPALRGRDVEDVCVTD
jgi:WD40 repeat protein